MTDGRRMAGFLLAVLLIAAPGCRDDSTDRADPSTPIVDTSATGPSTVTPPSSTGGAVEVDGLTATLEQYREDEIQGLVSVQVTNGSSSTVRFDDLRLQWAGLAASEAYVRSTQLSPGSTFDLRVYQGRATCGDPPRADTGPPPDAAIALGTASIDGAAPVVVAVPVDDERSVLPRVWARSCHEQRVQWAADLRFGERLTPTTVASGAPAMAGTIELRRRRADDVLTVTGLNGSVLLRLGAGPGADSSATLHPGDDALVLPIVIEQSGNCSPHALIESKKTFIIPIGFQIGDEEPTSYVIRFSTAQQELLNDLINTSCGLTNEP